MYRDPKKSGRGKTEDETSSDRGPTKAPPRRRR